MQIYSRLSQIEMVFYKYLTVIAHRYRHFRLQYFKTTNLDLSATNKCPGLCISTKILVFPSFFSLKLSSCGEELL